MTLAPEQKITRPASITDAFLAQLVARVPGSGGATWPLTEVYTGEVLVELPQSTPADIERAYATARAAQVGWAARAAANARSMSAGVDCGSSTSTSPV